MYNIIFLKSKERNKTSFWHDMTCGNFKDLARRTVSDKVLHDKAFNFASNQQFNEYPSGIALTFW